MDYQEIDIVLEEAPDGYRVRMRSTVGRASDAFRLPFSDLEIENFILRIGITRGIIRREDSPQMAAAREFGRRLFNALLHDEVFGRFTSALDRARLADSGLIVRLHLQDAPKLMALPWEFLYHESEDSFLALSTATPVVRFLKSSQPVPPLRTARPLRILGVVSNPSDVTKLDVDAEKKYLTDALQGLKARGLEGALEVHWLERSTLTALQRALRQREYHIFHFVGHGLFDRSIDEGALVFENDEGTGRSVGATMLGALLRDHRTLRLAVLNACEGARTGLVDPFGGVAPALVRAGLPAAVAMQDAVSDRAAITLAREFYGAIADGYPIHAALAEARKSIFIGVSDVEWATPVLYSRVEDGVIFQLPARAAYSQDELDLQYRKVVDLVRAEHWQEAWDCWLDLRQKAGEYPDDAHVAETARVQIQIARLYEQMSGLVAAKQWQRARDIWNDILQLDASFGGKDRDRLVPKIEAGMAAQREAEERKRRLETMYTEMNGLVSMAMWPEADRKWREIQKLDKLFPDRSGLVPTIERGLAEKGTQKAKGGRNPFAAVLKLGCAGTVVIGLIVIGVSMYGYVRDILTQPVATLAPFSAPTTTSPAGAGSGIAAPPPATAAVVTDADTIPAATAILATQLQQPAPTAPLLQTQPPARDMTAQSYSPHTVGTRVSSIGSLLGIIDLAIVEEVRASEVVNGTEFVTIAINGSTGSSTSSAELSLAWEGDSLYSIRQTGSDGTIIEYAPPQLVLQGPLVPGRSWSWQGQISPFGPGRWRTEVLGQERVTVPAGTFDALHLRGQGLSYYANLPFDVVADEWIVQGVGSVRRVVTSAADGTQMEVYEMTDFYVAP